MRIIKYRDQVARSCTIHCSESDFDWLKQEVEGGGVSVWVKAETPMTHMRFSQRKMSESRRCFSIRSCGCGCKKNISIWGVPPRAIMWTTPTPTPPIPTYLNFIIIILKQCINLMTFFSPFFLSVYLQNWVVSDRFRFHPLLRLCLINYVIMRGMFWEIISISWRWRVKEPFGWRSQQLQIATAIIKEKWPS